MGVNIYQADDLIVTRYGGPEGGDRRRYLITAFNEGDRSWVVLTWEQMLRLRSVLAMEGGSLQTSRGGDDR